MTLPVVLTPAASVEFDEAHDWYEARRLGLGADFAARVRAVFDRIAADPLFHPLVYQGCPPGARS